MTEMPITRLLPVALSDEEVRLHGEALARLEQLYEIKAKNTKAAAKAAKDDLAELREVILDLAARIERRQEAREVPCTERPNFSRQVVEIIRQDTDQVVEVRPMTLADHQLSIWETHTGDHA